MCGSSHHGLHCYEFLISIKVRVASRVWTFWLSRQKDVLNLMSTLVYYRIYICTPCNQIIETNEWMGCEGQCPLQSMHMWMFCSLARENLDSSIFIKAHTMETCCDIQAPNRSQYYTCNLSCLCRPYIRAGLSINPFVCVLIIYAIICGSVCPVSLLFLFTSPENQRLVSNLAWSASFQGKLTNM